MNIISHLNDQLSCVLQNNEQMIFVVTVTPLPHYQRASVKCIILAYSGYLLCLLCCGAVSLSRAP